MPLSAKSTGMCLSSLPNWVDREEVIHYPTDFSAMSQEDIQRLSARGEAVTRALVTQYLLSD